MKNILLFCVAFLAINAASAQICTPIPSYKDSTIGVYPKPFDPVTNPNGGIKKVACVGKDYTIDFQVIIPDTFLVSGFMVQMSSASITNVKNLPKGLSYTCSTPDCKFLAKKPGCIRVSGKIDPVVLPGNFELTIDIVLQTSFGPFPQSFPSAAIANGKYIIKVVKASDPLCISANSDLSDLGVSMQIVPNPANNLANVILEGSNIGQGKLQVFDFAGRMVYQVSNEFTNTDLPISLETSSFLNGVYTVRLSTENGQLTRKMVVNH